MDITEDAVKSVAQKISGSSALGCKDPEALQGWILDFGKNRKIFHSSFKTLVGWLSNNSPPWVAYCEFMSGCLNTLEKQPGIRPVGIGETWRHIFANIVLEVKGTESTSTCQDKHICAVIKGGIGGAVHRDQAICDSKSTTKYWIFLLVDAKNAFNEIN